MFESGDKRTAMNSLKNILPKFTLRGVLVWVFLAQTQFSQAQGVLEILSQPKDLTVPINDVATFSIEVSNPSGTPLTYQWHWNGAELFGMTNAAIRLTGVQPFQAGSYSVVVRNDVGTVTSDPAVLSVAGIVTWGATDNGENSVPAGLTNAVAMAGGPFHTVALKADGTLVGAGHNEFGQLNIPAGLGEVVAISLGSYHGLALTSTGTVVQWGDQGASQGNVPAGLGQVVAIAAGAYHSVALKADNSVVAWGNNSSGQTAVPPGLTNVVAIAAGSFHNLALRGDGTVVSWGSCGPPPPGLHDVVAISAGGSHDLALKADDTVVAWGDNGSGQTQVPPGLGEVTAVAAGGYNSIVLKADGTLVDWGLVGSTRMPTGLTNVVEIAGVSQHSLALLGTGPPFLRCSPVGHSAALGSFSAFRIEASGENPLTYQWRLNGVDLPGATRCALVLNAVQADQAGLYSVVVANRRGQRTSADARLTVVGIDIASQPRDQTGYLNGRARLSVEMAGVGPFHYQWRFEGTDLAGATESNLTLTNLDWSQDGLYSVQISNSYGALLSYPAHLSVVSIATWGDPGGKDVPTGLTNVVAISDGAEHMLALLADGTVRAWGQNWSGQLDVPPGLTNVVAIAAGLNHSVALKDDGTVVTWGDSPWSRVTTPVGLTGVVAIAASMLSVVALKGDGTVVAWGPGFGGMTNVPAELDNVVAISSAGHYRVALRADGSVAQWGDQSWSLFAPPAELTGVVAIAASDYLCTAVKNDGTLVTWGPDPSGGRATMPLGLSNAVVLAAGDNHFLGLQENGIVSGWGANSYGEASVPADLPPVTLVTAGFEHSAALVGTGPPRLITPPMSCYGTVGSSLGLRIVATGAWPLSYQWRFNGRDVFGATNCLLWLANLQKEQDGAYSVVVSNREGVLTSPEAIVSVPGVSISKQPITQQAYQGGNVSFGVEVTGQQPITYQWWFNGFGIAGATNSILALTNLQPEQAGDYLVRAGNAFGSVTSSQAQLTVLPLLIKAQPVSRQILLGHAVSFEVAVAGIPPLTYQWQFNGIDLPGMTNATLNLENVVAGQAGAYSVIVTSPFGSVASSAAMCYVLTLAGWGDNSYGQIDIPIGLTNVVAIAGGGDYTLALRANGTVVTWGDPRFPQDDSPMGLKSVVAIARGEYHNLALLSDGRVVGWGSNYYGQTNSPPDLTNGVAISAGANHNLGLGADGTVIAWGDNRRGQTAVPHGLTNVVAIAGVADYSLALRANGTVVAWGDNTFGQTDVPADLTNVVAISGEATHALALKLDGTLVAWGGTNQSGIAVPPDLTNVVAVSGGQAHDVALLEDGTVVNWGDNAQGQLNIPEGLTNVIAITAGREHTMALLSDGSPKLTVQPWDQQVAEGANPVLAGKAVGTQPMQYQWQLNGADIPGATNADYTVTNVQPANTGEYVLAVSNKIGTVSSRKNKLSLIPGLPKPPQFVAGSIIRRSDGSFQVDAEASPDSRLLFEASEDLLRWVTIGSAINTPGKVTFLDSPSSRARFYRLRLFR